MKTTKGKIISIVLATVAGFIISGIWYTLFGSLWQQLKGVADTAATEEAGLVVMVGELARTFILACVLAYFVVILELKTWVNTIQFGLIVWIGFPSLILLGSVLHENVHPGIAAIHTGDWLVKLLVMLAILVVRNNRTKTTVI
jgi:hypothetical protein